MADANIISRELGSELLIDRPGVGGIETMLLKSGREVCVGIAVYALGGDVIDVGT